MNMIRLIKMVALTVLISLEATRNSNGADDWESPFWIADATTYLLTAPLTTVQRQQLHAKNFNQLAPSARALYLRAVAFDVGATIQVGHALPSANLAEYLRTTGTDGTYDDWTQIPDFYNTEMLLTHKALVKQAMRELNMLIAGQVAYNIAYQQAMDAGAVDSFWWIDWYD